MIDSLPTVSDVPVDDKQARADRLTEAWHTEQKVIAIAESVVKELGKLCQALNGYAVQYFELGALPVFPNPPRKDMQTWLNKAIANHVHMLAMSREHRLFHLRRIMITEQSAPDGSTRYGLKVYLLPRYDAPMAVERPISQTLRAAQKWLYEREEDEDSVRFAHRIPQMPEKDLRFANELLKDIYDNMEADSPEAQRRLSQIRVLPPEYRNAYQSKLYYMARHWLEDKPGVVVRITESHLEVRYIIGRKTLRERWQLRRDGWQGTKNVGVQWLPCLPLFFS